VVAAVALAGCSGTLTANGQVSNGPAPTTSSTPAGTGGGYPSTGSTSSGGSGNAVVVTHPSATPECKANTLALSFGGADAGMNQQEQVLRFTNTGTRPCVIVGFPGVSYVTGDNGQQVGAPAVRTGKIGAQITLAPHATASTVIHSVNVGVFDTNVCRPTPVRGYRIYAPDDRAAMFIALPAGVLGCAGNPPDAQLSVVTIKAGSGNPDQS